MIINNKRKKWNILKYQKINVGECLQFNKDINITYERCNGD